MDRTYWFTSTGNTSNGFTSTSIARYGTEVPVWRLLVQPVMVLPVLVLRYQLSAYCYWYCGTSTARVGITSNGITDNGTNVPALGIAVYCM